jgi:carboxypeptidase Taq
MTNLNQKYEQLLEYNKELAIISSAGSILHWDMETKMPPKGVELRSQQLAFIQKTIHQKLTDPETGKLLDSIEKDPDYETLDQTAARNVYLSKKAYNEASKLPEKLVVDITKQQTIGVNVWKRAKAAKNWSLFMPELIKMKELKEREAELLMDIKGAKTTYDALIDNFEPKMTSEKITYLFNEMKIGLQKVLKKVLENQNVETEFLKRDVPIETQEKIAYDMANFVHYDTSSDNAGGRIDTTEHPFTTGYYTDVRITTHYHKNQFMSSIFSVLHEAGHALYEQNLPQNWMYQPVGTSASYGIHESMSRFIENLVGRSPQFWGYYQPKLKELTGNIFQDISKERMLKAINFVTPSKIRIEADEVTYGLHIIIRFEIERDLFEGGLAVPELPEVWNQKYMDYLGVDIEDDSEGVMQDTHWASGLFGYFPSYALGNIYDGVWLTELEKDLPEWKKGVLEGKFLEVKNWLKSNVYSYGNLYDPEDLVKEVTGKGLVVQPFIDYLENKFTQIYNS